MIVVDDTANDGYVRVVMFKECVQIVARLILVERGSVMHQAEKFEQEKQQTGLAFRKTMRQFESPRRVDGDKGEKERIASGRASPYIMIEPGGEERTAPRVEVESPKRSRKRKLVE